VQPCQVCGTADVDVNGYCVTCRTFRGVVQYEVVPTTYAPVSPASGGPPTSGPPTPAPPARRGRQVPLSLLIFTTAALLVVSTILIFTVVASSIDGTNRADAAASASAQASKSAPSPSPSASAAPAVLAGLDKCLIGSWVSTSDVYPVDQTNMLKVQGGPLVEFQGDGTTTFNYGSGVSYTGKVGKKNAEVLVTGQVTAKFATVNGTLNLTDTKPDLRTVYTLNGQVQANDLVPTGNQSIAYTCDGDKLTLAPGTAYPLTARRK